MWLEDSFEKKTQKKSQNFFLLSFKLSRQICWANEERFICGEQKWQKDKRTKKDKMTKRQKDKKYKYEKNTKWDECSSMSLVIPRKFHQNTFSFVSNFWLLLTSRERMKFKRGGTFKSYNWKAASTTLERGGAKAECSGTDFARRTQTHYFAGLQISPAADFFFTVLILLNFAWTAQHKKLRNRRNFMEGVHFLAIQDSSTSKSIWRKKN